MSNIFLKSDLEGIFNTTTESNLSLPQWITIVEKANQTDNKTSSAAVQLGGAYSVTSDNTSTKDVNKLISMLTSESSSQNFNAISETTTASLENQLRQILEKDGGGKKKKSKKQKGSGDDENIAVNDVKKFFMTLKSQGVNVNVKLNNKTMSEFFGDGNKGSNGAGFTGGGNTNDTNTTTDIPNEEPVIATYSDGKLISSETSSENIQAGGAKSAGKKEKKSSNKATKTTKSTKTSKNMDAGANPGFQAFLDMKKHIATKLGISNGPKAAKVAGAVQREMKEKFPNLDAVKIAEKGIEHFNANIDHFKEILNE